MLVRIQYNLILFFLFLGLSSSIFARAEEIDSASSDPHHLYPHLKVQVSTDRTVFRETQPIPVQLTVLNTEGNVESFSIFLDKEYFSYYVEVYTQEGISLPEKDAYFSQRFNDVQEQKLHPDNSGFKHINLSSGQIIGETLNLTELFDLPTGHYLVRVKFYPKTVLLDPSIYIYSPFIQIIVNPKEEEIKSNLQKRNTWIKEKETLLTPEDSVRTFFEGKKEKNWDKFFYVLDLSRLISIFPEFNDAYQRGTSDEKDSVLQNFQSYLQDVNGGEDIRSVEVEESIIRKKQAIVKVLVQLSLQRRLLSREYIFKLEKESHWVITAYTVMIR